MIKHIIFLGLVLLGLPFVHAQTYEQRIQTELASSYGLPQGTVVTNPDEAQVLAEAFTYRVTREDVLVQGQIFSNALRMTTPAQVRESYDHAGVIRNEGAISVGDRLLFVCYVRGQTVAGEQSIMRIWAEENGGNYEKYGGGVVYPTDEWQRILLPFEAPVDMQAGDVQLSFQVGFLTQTVEVAGALMLNYETALAFTDLPDERAPTSYLGQELSAPWRAQAATQIEQHRKSDLTVLVKDLNGNPLSNQTVSVRMLQHDYGFGSAVTSCFVDGLRCANTEYEDKIRDIDGEGHRFSEVVFENDLKWNGWEEGWYESKEGVVQALDFYRDSMGMDVRGHTLLWPCESNVPDDVRANIGDTAYVLGRIRAHFNDLLTYPGIAGRIQDWDLLNEVSVSNSVADAFAGQPGYVTGREFYPALFQMAKSLDAQAEFWYNDYQVIQQGGFAPGRRQTFYARANELIDAGAPLAGVGLQSHVSIPVPPVRVTELLDEVYDSIGLPIKITEFDFSDFANEQIEADYMRDFLTATFAHPATEAFLTWGFWDGAHYQNNAPFFRLDWSEKPAAQAFFDLVYRDWWTEETVTTDAAGRVVVRGFKGDYEVQVGDEIQELSLLDDLQAEFVISTSATTNPSLSLKPQALPNPTKGNWELSDFPSNAEVILYDIRGEIVAFAKTNQSGEVSIDATSLVKGVYLVKSMGYSLRLMKQ